MVDNDWFRNHIMNVLDRFKEKDKNINLNRLNKDTLELLLSIFWNEEIGQDVKSYKQCFDVCPWCGEVFDCKKDKFKDNK